MLRSSRDWCQTFAWCATSALVIVLIAGELTMRQPSRSWKLLGPATNGERAPVEENERGGDEIVAATPRQRARCRPTPQVHCLPPALIHSPLLASDCLLWSRLPDLNRRLALLERELPLRC